MNLLGYRSLVAEAAYPHQVELSLLGVHLRLAADHSGLAGAVAATFGAAAFQPAPGSQPKAVLRVLTVCPDEWQLVLSWNGSSCFVRWNPSLVRFDQYAVHWRSGRARPDGHFATRDLTPASATPEAVQDLFGVILERRLLAAALACRPRHYLVHAGVVRAGRGAVLVVGGSMNGKTTLTVALARAGLAFFGDDYAWFDTDASLVRPFPTALRLRATSLELLPGLNLGEVTWQPDANGHLRGYVPAERLFGPAPAPAPLGGVFLLQGFAERPRAERVEATHALFAALRAANLPVRDPGPALLALSPMFSGATCYHLWQGPPQETAALVRKLAEAADAA
jgi:hypothetical protein